MRDRARRRIAVAVLAAGGGSRLRADAPKPLVELAGVTLVDRALAAAGASGLAPLLLVVGHRADEVAAHAPPETVVVRNEEWQTGIATSLVAALRELVPRTEVEAVVIGLADQPLVGAEAYRRVAAAYDDGARLAAATYGGVRANPVLLARDHWREAMTLQGDEGARQLMRRHPVVEVSCDGTGDPTDVDTVDDLAALEAACASRTTSE